MTTPVMLINQNDHEAVEADEIVVSACPQCPFCVSYPQSSCVHPETPKTSRFSTQIYTAPDFCPLRERVVLIRFAAKES